MSVDQPKTGPALSPIASDILGSDNPKDYSLTLAKGLAILEMYSDEVRFVTLQSVADHLSTSRATARRLIMTLEIAGYVEKAGVNYVLASKCLLISRAFLVENSVLSILKKMVCTLSEKLECPCSLVSLDRGDVMFLCRDPRRRVYASQLALGDRLPAHASAGGKLLLANLDEIALEQWFENYPAAPCTRRTITSFKEMARETRQIREQGYAATDNELEDGVVSLAVPVRDNMGAITMALITSNRMIRATVDQLVSENLDEMLVAADEMSEAFGDFLRHNA